MNTNNPISRRDFVRTAAAVTSALALSPAGQAAGPAPAQPTSAAQPPRIGFQAESSYLMSYGIAFF